MTEGIRVAIAQMAKGDDNRWLRRDVFADFLEIRVLEREAANGAARHEQRGDVLVISG